MFNLSRNRLLFSLRLAGWHLAISASVALVTASVVFLIWFPEIYRPLLGVTSIFVLVVAVDVVCGPLLTFVLASPTKPVKELKTDILLVALVQIGALFYGIHVVSSTRPVLVVFERDRFVIVRASEIEPSALSEAPAEFNKLSWIGPQMAATRDARDGQELLAGVEMSLRGLGPSLRPGWWASYEQALPEVLNRALPVAELIERRPDHVDGIQQAVAQSGLSADSLKYLPIVVGKAMDWTALINQSGQVVATVQVDGFFD